MQQGWMFFGIGITMAILQGGWVRRIPPARTAKTATLVKKIFLFKFECLIIPINVIYCCRDFYS